MEFEDLRILKANELIDRLHSAELDGKSLRKLADDVENSLYKTATSDEDYHLTPLLRISLQA